MAKDTIRNPRPGNIRAARSLWAVAAACLLLASACSKHERQPSPYDREAPEVRVHTRSSGSTAPEATLLFWQETDFHDKLVTESRPEVQPYGTAEMYRDIDYYRSAGGETFSTGLRYGDGILHATGYAPTGALTPAAYDGSVEKDYIRLAVNREYPGYLNGQTDFLCCDGNDDHKGSATSPFTDEAHELKFRHLTSRIRFIGVRDKVMYDAISVSNVEVILLQPDADNPATSSAAAVALPVAFELIGKKGTSATEDSCTYKVSEWFAPESISLPAYTEFIPRSEEGVPLSACYVMEKYPAGYNPFAPLTKTPGIITLALQVKADFSRYNGGDPVKYDDYNSGVRAVQIHSDYGSTLMPGCDYVVTIRFKREGIALQGVQSAWEDGGTHYLPVEKPGSGEGE